MRAALACLLVGCSSVTVAGQSLPATLVARIGMAVPDVPGATYASVAAPPQLGANGHVAFPAIMSGGGAANANDFAVWVGQPGDLHIAIREDTPSGPEQFGTPNVNVDANGGAAVWVGLSFPTPINAREVLYSFLPAGNGGNTLVAHQGVTAAPGFAAGAIFAALGAGQAANDAGAVAFIGSAAGGDATSTSDQGLWTGTPGNVQLVAREGSPAPGASGTAPVFSTTTNAPILGKAINSSGQVAFAASISGAGVSSTNDRALYVWNPGGGGSLALAAQSGNVAPGTSVTIKFTSTGFDEQPGFNDSGQIAFRAQLISDVPGELNLINAAGIWAGAPGDVQLVARSGFASPIAGLQYRSPEVASPRINGSGQVAFVTLVSGSGVNSSNDRVYWVSTPGEGVAPVAREGAAAPGTGGAIFNVLDPISVINDLGQVALTGSLVNGGSVTFANDRGLWAGLPGDLQLVAREGDVLDLDPGEGTLLKTVQSISFSNGYSSPNPHSSVSAALNDLGQIAWWAQFTDGTTAVFRTTLPSAEPEPTADFDEDGDVDGNDFLIWQRGVGTAGATRADGNANPDEDGDVDGDDLAVWESQFGAAAAPATATVPEARSLVLAALAVGGLAMGRPRRRRRSGANE